MNVAALWVRTTWTKGSRGGARAARRNAVPVTFPLPEPGVFEVTMNEWSQFQPYWRKVSLNESQVSLTEEDDGRLRVQLIPVPDGHPMWRRQPPAVRLAAGQWIRWQINYRFSGYCCCSEWTYRLDTLNLAYGPTFNGPPTRYVDERVQL